MLGVLGLCAASSLVATALPASAAEVMSVTIAPPPDPISPGQVVTSPVRISNSGDVDAPAVVVVSLPKNVSGGITVAFTKAAGVTCTVYAPRYGSRRATCNVPTVVAGGSLAVGTIKVTAPTTVPFAGLNASVVATGPLDAASAIYRVRGSGPPDLTAALSVTPSTIPVGGLVTTTATISDAGYSPTGAFDSHLSLPVGAVPTSITSSSPGTTCLAGGDGVDCATSSLANGGTIVITTSFPAPVPGGLSPLALSVDVANLVAEGNETNNTSTVTLDIRSTTTAFAVSVVNPPAVPQGSVFTRSITVTNIGGADAVAVNLADRFTAFTYLGSAGPAGTSCRVLTSYSGRPATLHRLGATCLLGDIPAGGSVTVQLQLAAAGTLAAATYADTATATTTSYVDPSNTPSGTGSTLVFVPATPLPPTNTGLPVITGNPNTGSTLATSNGTWVAKGTIAYTYQWQRCDASGASCVDLAGATAATYVVQAGDVGATLRATVSATNSGGPTSATSIQSAVVVGAVAPSITTAPTLIAGLEKQPTFAWGVTTGVWSGTATITYSYQWQRCAIGGGSCIDIAGATSSSYVLQDADVFHSVRVKVTATNTAGSGIVYSDVSPEIDPLG